ncbi:MAG: hypothetical protein ACYTGG_02420 [Planctomycetota bacterium]|jgi:hypothetical protein
MKAMRPRSFGLALGRLRTCVQACCWIFALSLAIQILVWGMVTATDWHYAEVKGQPAETLVISPSDRQRELRERKGEGKEAGVVAVPNRVPSSLYIFFDDLSAVAGAVGTVALLVMVPLVMLGVVLVGTTASQSVEKSVTAMIWAVIVVILCLPVGEALHLPWRDGAFYDYTTLMSKLDAQDHGEVLGFSFFARHLLLPGACIIGTILLTWRFNAGIEPVIERREWLDPELEREAGNIKITSLHGGRAAGAFQKSVQEDDDEADEARMAAAAAAQPASIPTARAMSPGVAPKRII